MPYFMEAAMIIDDVVKRDPLPAAHGSGEVVKSADGQAAPRPAGGATQAESPPESSRLDRKAIEQAVAKVQETLGQLNTSLKIQIEPDTDRVVVKILNDQSGEIIRQIPSQEMVELAKRLDAMQGILLTKRT
jgi:flagellar protein FlaG